MKITYLGTTVLLFDDGKDRILFDCHFTRPSIPKFLFGKLRTDTAVADRVLSSLKPERIRAVFISHSHHDHILDAPYIVNKCGSDVYGSASALNVMRGGNVSESHLHLFKGSETFSIGKFQITVLPSIHSKPGFFNNDLGKTIDEPLKQPSRKSAYREGGSFDFLIAHEGRRYLIRPSYNFIPGQLDNIRADVLFLGIAGLSKDTAPHKEQFWKETVDKVRPALVIPLHWDNFFMPLYGPVRGMPKLFEDTGKSLHELAEYCALHGVDCTVQLPLTSLDL